MRNDEDIYEFLHEELEREPTEQEVRYYIERLRAHWEDMIESELTGN